MRAMMLSGELYPRRKSINWAYVRAALASRRDSKRMTALGYRRYETDWEIVRGSRYTERILDVQISADGKHVWTKIGTPPTQGTSDE